MLQILQLIITPLLYEKFEEVGLRQHVEFLDKGPLIIYLCFFFLL